MHVVSRLLRRQSLRRPADAPARRCPTGCPTEALSRGVPRRRHFGGLPRGCFRRPAGRSPVTFRGGVTPAGLPRGVYPAACHEGVLPGPVTNASASRVFRTCVLLRWSSAAAWVLRDPSPTAGPRARRQPAGPPPPGYAGGAVAHARLAELPVAVGPALGGGRRDLEALGGPAQGPAVLDHAASQAQPSGLGQGCITVGHEGLSVGVDVAIHTEPEGPHLFKIPQPRPGSPVHNLPGQNT